MGRNTRKAAVAAAATLLLAAGCARFEFYSDEALTHQTGLRFYTPKPYLLVAHTEAKDKPFEVSVVYLPDLSKPQYARARTGMGNNNLTMVLKDGFLTNFGQQTDTKIPELVTSLTGLVGAVRPSAAKAVGEPGKPPRVTLYEIDNSVTPALLREVKFP